MRAMRAGLDGGHGGHGRRGARRRHAWREPRVRRSCRGWRGRTARWPAAVGAALLALGLWPGAAAVGESVGEEQARRLLAPARASLAAAAAFDAKGNLPRAWRELDQALDRWQARLSAAPDSARGGAFAAPLGDLELRCERLVPLAQFVHDLRRQDRGWEAVAERWDRDLADFARAAGVRLDPQLAGSPQGRALLDSLGARRLRCRVQADSLAARWRAAEAGWREELAARDSTIAELRGHLGEAQRTLWAQEVRAGRAEADRSLVETRLRRQREREQAVRKLGEEFAKGGGEVVLTPQGEVVLRWPALAFPTGKAELTDAMVPHLEKLAAAIGSVPGAGLRVEGHSDAQGGHELNLRLSQARAEAVAAWLRQKLGWPPESVTAVGYGPDRPLAPNTTAAGRAKNRRIDVIILPVPEDSP